MIEVQIIPVAVATPYNDLPMMYMAARHSNLHIQHSNCQPSASCTTPCTVREVVAGMLLQVKVQEANCGPYA